MSDWAKVAKDCLYLERFIPEEHQDAYREITELAMRQAVMPDVEEALDDRPLAPVVDMHSRKVGS